MALRVTHTYALLEVSAAAHDEIAAKLREAGYDHVFGDKGEIDMHGIALTRAEEPKIEPITKHTGTERALECVMGLVLDLSKPPA